MLTSANRTGALLEGLRADRGWTRERMALEILRHPGLGADYSVSPRTIYRAECGLFPTVRVRYAIATVLDRAPSEIWPSVKRPNRKAVVA